MTPTWLPVEVSSAGLAVGAGVVAAINPCGFAQLPAFLSLVVVGDVPPSPTRPVGRALRATAGFAGVFLIFGLVVSAVAGSVRAFLSPFTVALGPVLVVAGFWVASGRALPAARLRRGFGRRS